MYTIQGLLTSNGEYTAREPAPCRQMDVETQQLLSLGKQKIAQRSTALVKGTSVLFFILFVLCNTVKHDDGPTFALQTSKKCMKLNSN